MPTHKILIVDIIKDLTEHLSSHFEMPEQHAWWILEAITQKNKTMLIADHEIALSDQQKAQLSDWIDKIVNNNMPLQYAIGSVPFADLEILVEPPTLIPRPETEEWCINLIEQLQQLPNTALTILDMCAGSGCIALALAKALPKATVYGLDIAPAAIALAKKNAIHNHITNATFLHSDLYDSLSDSFKFDIIVSNPPYITENAWPLLAPSVTHWEDKGALVAPGNGLAIVKKIIAQAPDYICKNGDIYDELKEKNIPQLMIEIGYDQGPEVEKIMLQHGFNQVTIHTDLAGKDRVVSGRIDNVATNMHK